MQSTSSSRPTLAFVIDRPDWAFANIIENIAPTLSERYDITRFFVTDYEKPAELIHDVYVGGDFDHIHFMWRELFFTALVSPLLNRVQELSGLTADALAERIAKPVTTTSVYDHLFLNPGEINDRRSGFAMADAYAVSSAKLMDAYLDTPLQPPAAETPDAVNFARFARARAANAQPRTSDKIVIGWVGNSTWGKGNDSLAEDPKGFHSLLHPAVEILTAEGLPVRLHIADRNIRQRDKDEMVDYYGEIDVLVCSSSHEGTPNPILEAMAAGLPFVSTDVGLVREVSGPLQHEFIMPERSLDAMTDTLRRFIANREIHAQLAAENLERIAQWTWASKVPAWEQMFEIARHRHKTGSRESRFALIATRLGTDRAGAQRAMTLETQLTKAQAQITTLIQRRDALLETNKNLLDRIATLKSTNEWLVSNKQAKASADDLIQAQNEITRLRAEIDRLYLMDQAARDELDRLRAEVAQLYAMDQAARQELDHRAQLLQNRRASLRHFLRGRR